MDRNSPSTNVKSEFSVEHVPLNGNYNTYQNSNTIGYQNYGSPNDFAEPEAKRRIIIYPSLDSALSPPQPSSPWPTTNASTSSTSEADDQRFTAKKKQEIQQLIEQGQVVFEPTNEGSFNKVLHNGVPLGLQCASCFALFSTRTRTYLKAHAEKCMTMAKNQAPYPLTAADKRMINFYMAELMAMDSRFALIAETEAFQRFISYIKDLGFNVGRKFTNYMAPIEVLPPPLSIKQSLESEVLQVVRLFKDFLLRQKIFESVIALDHGSLGHNYMGIIVRFVHKWQLKSFIINVQDVSQIGTNKIAYISKILAKCNIQFNNHFIVSDEDIEGYEGANFSFCVSETLKSIINRSLFPNKDIKKEDLHNIFDKTILQTLDEFHSILDKLENVVDATFSKPSLSKLKSLTIFFEHRHKWASKVEMVEAWLKITEADNGHLQMNFGGDNEIYESLCDLSRNHHYLNALITVLKPFQDKLKFFQADLHSTINHVLIAFYELENHLEQFKDSTDVLVKAICASTSAILNHMRTRFTQPVHYVACTMDIFQRAKIRQLREIAEVKKAKEETEKFFVDYIKRISPIAEKDVHEVVDDFAMCPDDELESNQNSLILAAKSELAQYYRYTPSAESVAQKDALLFWKSVTTQFPQLSKFASFVLSIPASSNFIDKICPTSTKIAAKEKSLDVSIVSDLMLYKSLQNLNLF